MVTLKELGEKVTKGNAHCICGAKLDGYSIKSYDHEDGIEIEGYTEKQWVYVTCSCNYQMAYWKIKKEIEYDEYENPPQINYIPIGGDFEFKFQCKDCGTLTTEGKRCPRCGCVDIRVYAKPN